MPGEALFAEAARHWGMRDVFCYFDKAYCSCF